RLRVHAELLGNVAEIDTALDQCLNRHEVLQSQHLSLLPMGIGEGTLSLGVGGLPISVFSGLLPSALTRAALWPPGSGARRLHRTLQPDVPRRGARRLSLRFARAGARDHRGLARDLQHRAAP